MITENDKTLRNESPLAKVTCKKNPSKAPLTEVLRIVASSSIEGNSGNSRNAKDNQSEVEVNNSNAMLLNYQQRKNFNNRMCTRKNIVFSNTAVSRAAKQMNFKNLAPAFPPLTITLSMVADVPAFASFPVTRAMAAINTGTKYSYVTLRNRGIQRLVNASGGFRAPQDHIASSSVHLGNEENDSAYLYTVDSRPNGREFPLAKVTRKKNPSKAPLTKVLRIVASSSIEGNSGNSRNTKDNQSEVEVNKSNALLLNYQQRKNFNNRMCTRKNIVFSNTAVSRAATQMNFKNLAPALPPLPITRSKVADVPTFVSFPVTRAMAAINTGTKYSYITLRNRGIQRLVNASESFQAPQDHVASSNVQLGNEENDVAYLYTVDSSPNGRIVEEIDLSQESENASIAVETGNCTKAGNQRNVKEPITSAANKNRKRKSIYAHENSSKRSNSNSGVLCSSCHTSYESVTKNGQHMFISNCGFMYCEPCIQQKITGCEACGKTISHSFRKLFL